MPRPPGTPEPGRRRMGARQWITRQWRRRSISTAVLAVCLWVCLITAINLTPNGRVLSWVVKEDTLYGGKTTFSDTLDLSAGYRAASRAKQGDNPNLHSQPKASIYMARDGQTGGLMENGIISGRRMQEIKAVEMEGLEPLSRVYERDDGDREPGNILISTVGDQIDGKAISVMGIKPDIQATERNPKDLLPNWTPEPEMKMSSSSLSRVHELDRPRSRDEKFLPDHDISSRVEKSLSETDSFERKKQDISENTDISPRLDSIEQADVSKLYNGTTTRGFNKGKNSASSHLRDSIGETHNLHSGVYDRASIGRGEMRIDTRLNVSKTYITGKGIELSTYSFGSRTRPTDDSYLPSLRSNSDGVKNTHNLKATRLKSNKGFREAMQMMAPNRNHDFSSPFKVLSRTGKSMNAQTDPVVKYSTLFHRPHLLWEPLVGATVKSNPSQDGDGSNPVLKTNNLPDEAQHEIRLSVNSQTGSNQLSTSRASGSLNSYSITYSLVDLSGSQASRLTMAPKGKGEHEHYLNDGFELYSYNMTASNMISLDRFIPDTRPEGCTQETDLESLPRASVIICFHNEALSVLLRTIRSILDRSPPELLEQIILVDDNSTLNDLKTELEDKLLNISENIVLARTTKREGLVRARLLGSDLATADVIIFLDAHCECNVGWLEPLLLSLRENPHKVVSPYIDTIKAENFQYKKSPANLKGGFNWRLEFGWRAAKVGSKAGAENEAIITPVISGGLFAVWRVFFQSIGSYDPELDIWGGENFELSFKTWMCGGSLEIIPCSRVGHVFRVSLPYSFNIDREEVVLRNLGRVASVWMDDYADVFYAAVNMPKDVDVGDISQRLQLRKNLKCQSFDWYIFNVFPQLEYINRNTLHYGMVRNKGSVMCLDVINSATDFYLGLSPCHSGKNQTFRLSTTNRLSQGEACIKPGTNKQLFLSMCRQNISWIYQNGFLRLDQTELCLTSVDNEVVQLLPCNANFETNLVVSKSKKGSTSNVDNKSNIVQNSSFQQWTFDYSFNWKRKRRKSAPTLS